MFLYRFKCNSFFQLTIKKITINSHLAVDRRRFDFVRMDINPAFKFDRQHSVLESMTHERGSPMLSNILVSDKEYTFQEIALILAQALSSITDENDDGFFSMADIFCLLHSVNEYVLGEFQIQQVGLHYYKIVYKTEHEVIGSFKERWEGFIE